MPSLKNYQEIKLNNQVLTEREIRQIRKFAGISGQRLIKEVKDNPSHKWRNLVLEFWWEYNNNYLTRNQAFQETFCDVSAGSFDCYYLSQGLAQKKTYRFNRLEENMRYIRSTMSRGEWQDLPIVWEMNTNLTPYGQYAQFVRVPSMSSYVIANNALEASSVWTTMVLAPLGMIDLTSPGAYRRDEARASFVGPTKFVDCNQKNAESMTNHQGNINEKIEEIKTMLSDVKEVSKKAQLAFALMTSTLLATNG